jgi:hypothetical protein
MNRNFFALYQPSRNWEATSMSTREQGESWCSHIVCVYVYILDSATYIALAAVFTNLAQCLQDPHSSRYTVTRWSEMCLREAYADTPEIINKQNKDLLRRLAVREGLRTAAPQPD